MDVEFRAGIMTVIPLVLQLLGLTFAVAADPYIIKIQKRILLINIVVIFSLVMQNFLGYLVDLNGHMIFERIVIGVYGYCLRPVVIVLLFYLVDYKRKYLPFWLLILANTLLYLTAFFTGTIAFTIDSTNHFHRGVFGYSCHVVSAICLMYLVYITLKEYGDLKLSERIIPIINSFLIVAAVAVDSVVDYRVFSVTFMMIAVVSGVVFYYIWLHLQFVRKYEDALLAEQRIKIMMTQIQPHFLYNTLSTIQALCKKDPDQAFIVTERFGAYLRQNLSFLDQTDLVPIVKEIEHTKIYADIEKVRFPYIDVTYDIDDSDFEIPALTIQPLVENAIRHGVRIREQGIVRVETEDKDAYHEIRITDNGKGFDVNQIEDADETHIGIRNVRERLEKMCGASMDIVSGDDGTSITIRITKKFEV